MHEFAGLLGPERFIEQFRGHINRGESVICVIPECERFRAEPFLRSEAGEWGFDTLPVDADSVSALPDAIASAANIPPVKSNIRRLASTLTSLIESPSAPDRPVIFLRLSADETGLAIANAIGDAYPALRYVEATRRPRLCLSIPHSLAPDLMNSKIQEDIKTLQWCNFVVDHDVRTVVADRMADLEMPAFNSRLLGEVIAELALWDLDCAKFLLSREIRDGKDINNSLLAYSVERGWGPDTANSLDTGTLGVCDGVERTHSAALLLRNEIEELSKRVWRAQLGIVLPEIDEIRIFLINKYKSLLEESIEEEVELIDYGLLCQLLSKNWLRVAKRDLEVIQWCRLQRNDLSHLKPISMNALLTWRHWDYARDRT